MARKKKEEVAIVASQDKVSKEDILSVLSIEKAAKGFNKSAAIDVKVNRFVEGNYSTPSIFKPGNFEKYAKTFLVKQNELGVSEIDIKVQLLESMTKDKVAVQIEAKKAEFSVLPLNDQQKTAISAAMEAYEVYLNDLASKAVNMVKQFNHFFAPEIKISNKAETVEAS
jgi:hypothetical protein